MSALFTCLLRYHGKLLNQEIHLCQSKRLCYASE
jgi:hypothetical protein